MRKAPEPRSGEPITLVHDKQGAPRYRTVLDYAPPGQPREQRRATFNSLTEARAHVAAVKAQREAGTQATRDRDTFEVFAKETLHQARTVGLKKGRNAPVRPVTMVAYEACLQYARDAFGTKPVGRVTEADVEALVASMADRGLSRRTTALTLMLTRSVLARAMRQGAVSRNVAEHVGAQGAAPKARKPLTLAEVRAVAGKASEDRLAACWRLTMLGMRRSEVLGLRWLDVDLERGTVRVTHGRTGDDATLTEPKTKASRRTIHLQSADVGLLRAWRARLVADLGVAAGKPGAFVAVDPFGDPIRPEVYSDSWVRLCHSAGIKRRVLLHEARHSSVTMLRAAGVPDRLVAAHHGHDEAVMRSVYDHAALDSEGLATVTAALGAIITGT